MDRCGLFMDGRGGVAINSIDLSQLKTITVVMHYCEATALAVIARNGPYKKQNIIKDSSLQGSLLTRPALVGPPVLYLISSGWADGAGESPNAPRHPRDSPRPVNTNSKVTGSLGGTEIAVIAPD